MYNDSNLLGDGAKEGRGSKGRHAGTGEGISAYIHVANSHADRAEGSFPRKNVELKEKFGMKLFR